MGGYLLKKCSIAVKTGTPIISRAIPPTIIFVSNSIVIYPYILYIPQKG